MAGRPKRARKAPKRFKDGGAVKATQVLLAHKYDPAKVDPATWWMSEKLDGVRAYWSGTAFFSRNGNRFCAPTWFTAALPKDTPLDGELWGGRGQFTQALSVVRTQKGDANRWKNITYAVFDAPELKAASGAAARFEERMEYCITHFKASRTPYAAAVVSVQCKSAAHLNEELERTVEAGGEGLMLRRAGSLYEHGRSYSLLKVKKFFDEEAKVTGYQAGHGKNTGKVGALLLVTPDGREVKVGTGLTDKERTKPPKVGAIVTYKYFELSSSGNPRFPAYVCERFDLDWDTYKAEYTMPAVPKSKPLKRTHTISFGPKMGLAAGDTPVKGPQVAPPPPPASSGDQYAGDTEEDEDKDEDGAAESKTGGDKDGSTKVRVVWYWKGGDGWADNASWKAYDAASSRQIETGYVAFCIAQYEASKKTGPPKKKQKKSKKNGAYTQQVATVELGKYAVDFNEMMQYLKADRERSRQVKREERTIRFTRSNSLL